MKNSSGKNPGIFSGTNAARIIVSLICICLIGGLMIYSFKNALNRNQKTNDKGNTVQSRSDLSVSSNIPVADSTDSSEDNSESGSAAEHKEKKMFRKASA